MANDDPYISDDGFLVNGEGELILDDDGEPYTEQDVEEIFAEEAGGREYEDDDELFEAHRQAIEQRLGRTLTHKELRRLDVDLERTNGEPVDLTPYERDLGDRDQAREWMVERLADGEAEERAQREEQEFAAPVEAEND